MIAPAPPASGTCTGTPRRPRAQSRMQACGPHRRPLLDAVGNTEEMESTALADLEAPGRLRPGDRASAGPHSIYTVSEGLLRWTAEQAAEHGVAIPHPSLRDRAGGRGLPRRPRRAAGRLPRPARRARRETVLAHGVWLDEPSWRRSPPAGRLWSPTPVANLKLAVAAVSPYPAARRRGPRSARHRRRRVPTTRSTCSRPEDLRADAAPPQRRPDRAARRRGLGDRDRARAPALLGAAARPRHRAGSAHPRRPRRLPAAARRTLPSWGSATWPPTSSTRRALRRRHHHRRRTGADAGREVESEAEILARAAERARRLGIA